ncbi:MAG: hypothetical protein ACQEP5_07990 [Actinomycetota bacterium]
MDTKISKAIKSKIKDIDKLMELDSRHPRFKTWQVSTMSILKNLPPEFNHTVKDFKKLTFEDTKYHRGKNLYDPSQKDKFIEDLQAAKKILTVLVSKKEDKPS